MELVTGEERHPHARSGESVRSENTASTANLRGARTVFTRPQRWTLLAVFAAIVALRLPHAWAHGRFQDEEATVFFAYAWHYPWLGALFRPFAGYWNLTANATTLLDVMLVRRGILPLELAPYFTMVAALAAQLLPALLILTGNAQWLANRLAVVAALLMIAIMPATEEVFLNVMHIQFQLALGAALILALDVPTRRIARVGYAVLLFVAPLCGPGAIVILPLFALRAVIDRDSRRMMQFATLGLGAAVQLLFFYHSSPIRGHFFGPFTLSSAMFVRFVALPTLGVDLSRIVGGAIYRSVVAGGTLSWWFAAATPVVFGALIVVASKRRDAAIWLVLSALSIATTSLGFGMVAFERYRLPGLFEVLSGERYNFLPLVLLGLALIVLARRPNFQGSTVCAALCGLMLLAGVLHYPKPVDFYADGPSWPEEVRMWRHDHRHPLAVWPTPWTADLSDETRPCSPPKPDTSRLTDPRYCESGWLAAFYVR